MTDEDLKKMAKVVDNKIKPLHVEMAKIKQELIELKYNSTKANSKISKIDRDLARVDSRLEVIQDKQQEGKDWMGEEFGQVNIKLDELLVEKDKIKKDIKQIKQHVGLPN